MECINGRMEIDMKENGKTVLNMVKERIYSRIKMSIQDNMSVENLMEQGTINGVMEQVMLANFKKDINMEKVNGVNLQIQTQIHMKDNTLMTRKTVMGSLGGHQEILIKETIKMTKETVMEK